MPRFDDNMEINNIQGMGTMTFSSVKPEELGASAYTIVTIVIDITGSVQGFESDLEKTLISVVDACKKNERSENLMLRVVTFNSSIGINEIHGFKELHMIDINEYNNIMQPTGMTNLFDAVYSSISATLQYSTDLISQDFDVNGAIYILTDGDDNHSKMTKNEIKKLIVESKRNEVIDSLITVLIGMNNPKIQGNDYSNRVKGFLEDFQNESNIDEFVDMGNATPQRLAKLADFVSKSVISQNSSVGSGVPSQIINPVF